MREKQKEQGKIKWLRDFLTDNKIFFETMGVLALTGLGIFIAWNQNIISTNQNEIMENQTIIMENQANIMEREYLPTFTFSSNFTFNKALNYSLDHNKLIISNIGSPANDFNADISSYLHLTATFFDHTLNQFNQTSLDLPVYGFYWGSNTRHEVTGIMIEFDDSFGIDNERAVLFGEKNLSDGAGNWVRLLNVCNSWNNFTYYNANSWHECEIFHHIHITYRDTFGNPREEFWRVSMVNNPWTMDFGSVIAYKIPKKEYYDTFKRYLAAEPFFWFFQYDCKPLGSYLPPWENTCNINWSKYMQYSKVE